MNGKEWHRATSKCKCINCDHRREQRRLRRTGHIRTLWAWGLDPGDPWYRPRPAQKAA